MNACNARGAKRGKVSSNRDSEKTDSKTPKESQTTCSEHPQPNVKDEAPVHSETGL